MSYELTDLLACANVSIDINNINNLTIDDSEKTRLLSSIAALLININPEPDQELFFNKSIILDLVAKIDYLINQQLNEVLHNKIFQEVESVWRGLYDVLDSIDSNNKIIIDILDVTKDELYEDAECNSVDMTGSALFQKTYASAYDQYGGNPYGALIGIYEFGFNHSDEYIIRNMAKLANANHSPFITSVGPSFFGCNNIEELAAIKDLSGLLDHPKYGSWDQFRETQEAAYVGLTLPKYLLRLPYENQSNNFFCENMLTDNKNNSDNKDNYLWGNAAILFAKNMIKSFLATGWCQHIRGPKGGGIISNLPIHVFDYYGQEEIKIPVEMSIPDYRELEYANCGFMPLVYQHGTSKACFFSCQSVKKANKFIDHADTENSKLVTNLAYTMSITRIAHYVKCIMRDNIGSNADPTYIQKILNQWLMKYVTEISNPDDLSLQLYPFKQAKIAVSPQKGNIGWYNCQIYILPHLQFEGMDVELILETRLAN